MTTKTAEQLTTTQTPEPTMTVAPPIDQTQPAPMTWLTLETLLYGLILVIGLALRLWQLGKAPLSDIEAQQALTAFNLYRGDPLTSAQYSPLLTTFNTFTFFILNHSDATARLVAVLWGIVLMVLPYTLRRQLGREVCLLAAAVLALSPIALFFSRTLNGEIAVVAGALMIVSGFFNWADAGRPHWLYLLAAGLAVALTAGPMAFSVLMIFALIVAIRWPAFKQMFTQALAQDKQADETEDLRNAAIFFLVVLLLLATAATLNLGGFGVTTGLIADWLSRFELQPRAGAGFNAVFLLTIYEPLLVIASFIGLAYAVLSNNLLRQSLAIWFVATLLLDLITVGRPAGTVTLALAPLAFLAAIALAELWRGLKEHGKWSNEGIILVAGLTIAAFAYIGLTGWLSRACAADDTICQFAWLQSVAALTLFLVIVGFFWVMNGAGVALRGLALTALALGLIVTINIGWRLNYGPLMNRAYQPITGISAATDLIRLQNTLTDESTRRTRDARLLDIALIGPQPPALLWQLRNFENLTQENSRLDSPAASAIITSAVDNAELGLGEPYLGQDFAVNAYWSPVGMAAKDLVNWLVYRHVNQPQEGNRVILWLRVGG